MKSVHKIACFVLPVFSCGIEHRHNVLLCYNNVEATEVPVNNLDKPSAVAASLIQTLSWKDRKAKKIAIAENGVMEDVLLRIIPLIGAELLFEE